MQSIAICLDCGLSDARLCNRVVGLVEMLRVLRNRNGDNGDLNLEIRGERKRGIRDRANRGERCVCVRVCVCVCEVGQQQARERATAVSYTPLRSHETKANLVCRLLL